MCPPDFYGIEYEINPWMNRSGRPTIRRPSRSGRRCVGTSKRRGRRCRCSKPVEGLPDLVFTANAALIFGKQAVLSHFRHPQRQGEEPHDRRWLDRARLRSARSAGRLQLRRGRRRAVLRRHAVRRLPHAQRRARPSGRSASMLGVRVIPLELVDPYYYHLDTCFCPLAPGAAIYYPAGVRRLRPAGDPTARAEADRRRRGGSRTLRLQRRGGRQRVVTNTGCDRLHAALAAARLRTDRHAARRIRQSRRQREVPHAAARRRRSGGLEALVLRPVVDDHVTVVGHIEQRPVRARVAAAGVAAPMPDQVDADVPGFLAGRIGRRCCCSESGT